MAEHSLWGRKPPCIRTLSGKVHWGQWQHQLASHFSGYFESRSWNSTQPSGHSVDKTVCSFMRNLEPELQSHFQIPDAQKLFTKKNENLSKVITDEERLKFSSVWCWSLIFCFKKRLDNLFSQSSDVLSISKDNTKKKHENDIREFCHSWK